MTHASSFPDLQLIFWAWVCFFLKELLKLYLMVSSFGRSTCSSHLLVQLKEPGPEVDLSPPEKPPKFTKAIESFEVAEGGQCFFRYRVTGKPLPDIQWLKGGFHIQPNEFCVIINHSDGSGFINMKNAKLEHSGVYTCKAFNQNGEDCCTAELLVVTHRTCEEDHRVVPLEVNAGSTARFECETEFAPNVSFKWFKDGHAIKASEKCRIISRFTASSLELLSPTQDDSGEYTCEASNQHGSDKCSASLTKPQKAVFYMNVTLEF
uniref:Ig-like domain-containing protein n=1 Tax=Oryzias melastigma TaxID=30732 RepID=A0A3B3DK64_ORYME